MAMTTTIKTELLKELKQLPERKLYEILDFTLFIKNKDNIDLSQSYFWTKKWHSWEMEAEEDKKNGKVIGNGSFPNLLKKLKE